MLEVNPRRQLIADQPTGKRFDANGGTLECSVYTMLCVSSCVAHNYANCVLWHVAQQLAASCTCLNVSTCQQHDACLHAAAAVTCVSAVCSSLKYSPFAYCKLLSQPQPTKASSSSTSQLSGRRWWCSYWTCTVRVMSPAGCTSFGCLQPVVVLHSVHRMKSSCLCCKQEKQQRGRLGSRDKRW